MSSWGSSDPRHGHHLEAVEVKTDGRRRGCRYCAAMGLGKVPVTHVGKANGIALVRGCKWHVRKWARRSPKWAT